MLSVAVFSCRRTSGSIVTPRAAARESSQPSMAARAVALLAGSAGARFGVSILWRCWATSHKLAGAESPTAVDVAQ